MTLVRLLIVSFVILVLAACTSPPPKDNLIVVLPESNGHVGAVVVHNANGGETLLNKPYAAAGATAGSTAVQPVSVSDAEVSQIFGAAMAARPMPPQNFVLYFKSGTDILTDKSARDVKLVFAELARRKAAEIAATGFTDTVGNLTDNDKLSLQRAEKLRSLLIQEGIRPSDIVAAGRGKRELLVQTGDQVDEPCNRRVEITVR